MSGCERVEAAVAETFPKIHWGIWTSNQTEPDHEGGFDGYAYGLPIYRFGPAPLEELQDAMIKHLRWWADRQRARAGQDGGA